LRDAIGGQEGHGGCYGLGESGQTACGGREEQRSVGSGLSNSGSEAFWLEGREASEARREIVRRWYEGERCGGQKVVFSPDKGCLDAKGCRAFKLYPGVEREAGGWGMAEVKAKDKAR